MTWVEALPWIISAGTFAGTWAIGNKVWWCWLLVFFVQEIWLLYILTTRQWGLLPGMIALSSIHVRNHLRWQREESKHRDSHSRDYARDQGPSLVEAQGKRLCTT